MHDLCVDLCFPSTTSVPFLLTPLPLCWPPCHPLSPPGMLPANSMWLLHLEALHHSASGFPERAGYHPGRMRIWEEGGSRHHPLPSQLFIPQQGQKPNCHLGKDRVNLIWASRPCSRWFVLFLKKKKNTSNCQVLFRNLNILKILTKRGGCTQEKILSERGDVNPMWQGYFFFSGQESRECKLLSWGSVRKGASSGSHLWGLLCVGGVLGSPPTSSIWFIRQLYLINSHSVLKPGNLEHQKFIVGPILSFLQWAN